MEDDKIILIEFKSKWGTTYKITIFGEPDDIVGVDEKEYDQVFFKDLSVHVDRMTPYGQGNDIPPV